LHDAVNPKAIAAEATIVGSWRREGNAPRRGYRSRPSGPVMEITTPSVARVCGFAMRASAKTTSQVELSAHRGTRAGRMVVSVRSPMTMAFRPVALTDPLSLHARRCAMAARRSCARYRCRKNNASQGRNRHGTPKIA